MDVITLAERAGRLPRMPLGTFPTPLTRPQRLEAALRSGRLVIKRDDLTGFAVAGNKTRPLEFLIGEARRRGAEVLVTGGGPGSNFCPAAALAARAAGLECELVVWGNPVSANLALAAAAGARLRPTGDGDREAVDTLVRLRAEELAAAGRRSYAVPRGGSTELGAVGFALAAAELATQLAGLNEPVRLIVVPVGSGGSCAGLLAGMTALGLRIPVLGVTVSRPPEQISRRLRELAEGCARLLGIPPPVTEAEIHDARGPGFGRATGTERCRARLALRTEGLFFDETYGAETLSAAIDRLNGGTGPVLLWHTGGLVPAIGAVTAIPEDAL